MAHMAKYKSAQCPNMLHHYRRDREATLARDNVDRGRTHMNYTLGPDGGLERIRERVAEVEATMTRSVRSDAIVMCDWVVTAPPDLRAEDQREFFESCYDFVRGRYGDENMLGGYVHMDETTPHIHIALIPVVERDGGRLAMSAKEMFTRQELLRFHGELSDRVAHDLGYRPQIETTGERTLERALSRAGSLEEYQKAKDRLERLRHDERELGARNRELGGRAEELRGQLAERERELREAQDRERQVEESYRERQEKAQALRGEVGRAEAEHQRLVAEDRRLEREHSRLEGIRDRLAERVRELRERLGRALERVKERLPRTTEAASERVKGLAEDFDRAGRVYDRVRELSRCCQEAADRFGPGNGDRLEEIYRRLNVNDRGSGHGLEARLAYAEDSVERTAKRLEELREHPLRNRKEIAREKEQLERDTRTRDGFKAERDELAAERDRLKAAEEERTRNIRAAQEPYRGELEELQREHGRLKHDLEARYRGLSDEGRNELERAMQDRNRTSYGSVRSAYEYAERQRAREAEEEARAARYRDEHGRGYERDDYRDLGYDYGRGR